MNEKLWWYVARSGGLVAWWTVSASVLVGLVLSTRVVQRRGIAPWLLAVHRFLGGLAVVFTGIHIAGLVADSWVHFGWSDVLVPLASRWRPVAVAWGVIGFYLLLAIEVTSLLMRRLPRRWWRAVHSSAFALFVLSGVHAFSAGADGDNPVVQWSGLVIAASFTFLVLYRQLVDRRSPAPAPKPPVELEGAATAEVGVSCSS
ncbi:MAG TPA: ferric reductase-like transmembrane domain-containing protein [Acidimicrobiia bacterium]|nr:ferric reductase-like transmembrane domain-containing protein [Acidimicrobiia bacterium]